MCGVTVVQSVPIDFTVDASPSPSAMPTPSHLPSATTGPSEIVLDEATGLTVGWAFSSDESLVRPHWQAPHDAARRGIARMC
jgi:hypothetical protein